MNCRKGFIKTAGFSILVVLSAVSSFMAAPAAAASKDAMDLLPSDCTVCVRVNNLQVALGQMDQYLVGATPMPMNLSMMATMQLTGIFGDPLLTGINMQGNFVMAAIDMETQQTDIKTQQKEKDLFLFFLIPSSGMSNFLKGNKNLSPAGANGVYTLKAPNSSVGGLAIIPLSEPNYLLISREQNKTELLAVQKAIKEKKASLRNKLSPDAGKAAAENPAWAYVNVDKLYQLYGSKLTDGFNEMQKTITAQTAQKNGPVPTEMMSKSFDIFKYFIEQADWMTLSLNPAPQQLQIETAFSAKTGSELAGMLKPSPTLGKDWQYAGLLNDASSFKAVCRLNKPLIEQLYTRMIDIFGKNAAEADKPQFEKMKALVVKSVLAMGDEVAMSFSYRAGMPPFEMKEVVQVKDPKTMLDIQKEITGLVTTMYAAMGMPMTFTYAPSVEKYNGTDIGLYQFKFTGKDPNDETMKAIEMMYGKQGLQYPMAVTADKFLIAMGPDATTQIKAMIDAKQPGPAAGDIKTAFTLIPDNTKAEIVASINLLRLIKGASEMGQQMVAQQGMNMPNFWKGIDIGTTTSCMATAVFIENGRVRCRTILPKEHLAQTAKVLMQVQQQQMNYYMQQSQKKPGSDANSVPAPKHNPY
jgi:hypothetical protein